VKILLTVHQFFPHYFSGTEVLTYSSARELLRRGHEVAVLTGFPAATLMDDGERFDEYDIDGIHVYRFHHGFVPMGEQSVVTEIEYDNHLLAQYFTKLLDDFKPDVVHFFHMSRLGVGMIDAVVTAGIPAYYTPTDFWSVCPTSQLLLDDGKVCGGPTAHGGNCVRHVASLAPRPRIRALARRVPDAFADLFVGLTAASLLPRHALSGDIAAMRHRKGTTIPRLNWLQGIVSPTTLMTRVLTDHGVDPRLIVQSGYGIDVGGYDAEPAQRGVGATLTIGFIGTLAPHKGCHVLIDAFKRLQPGSARLRIYGNPAEFPNYVAGLQQRAEGCSGIEFSGTFPNAEIASVLAGMHVLVVPSLWYENAPLVVYSALAAKRPVIASDFPGLAETVTHDANGLLFAPGDVNGLATQLSRLIETPELLGALSANCHPPKSTSTYVGELLALYAEGLPNAPDTRDHAGLRTFAPLVPTEHSGSLAGWAVVGLAAPTRIVMLVDNEPVGETRRFLPRPDVREGLKRGGVSIKAHALGFVLRAPEGLDRGAAILRCETAYGRGFEVPLRELTPGTVHNPSKGDFIAIDSERVEWQAGSA
jgi:glycosyltransferase involved in cell wall biosynthesis